MQNLSSKKLILALLYASGKKGFKEPIVGITKFEKMILFNSYIVVYSLKMLNFEIKIDPLFQKPL